jgi:hypothetical protein
VRDRHEPPSRMDQIGDLHERGEHLGYERRPPPPDVPVESVR